MPSYCFLTTDINECERETHTCHPDRAYCLNRDGGYDCKCKDGYVLSDDGDCIGNFNQIDNDYASYRQCLMCSNFSNVDLNECNGLHSCNPRTSVCFNTIGSYKCNCLPGFAHIGNERTCKGQLSQNFVLRKDLQKCQATLHRSRMFMFITHSASQDS